VLLTRSPLSPGPKAWFSLDLHVLSAPPAFVLSQDQTLRKELLSLGSRKSRLDSFVVELELKGPRPKTQTGLRPQVRGPEVSTFCTLLSFQRPSTTEVTGEKKPPTRAGGLESSDLLVVSDGF
jgi:hypothetical protein